MKRPAVYIMASQRNGTLCVGVTASLPLRVFQHREGLTPGFTRRYHCKMLVYYEMYEDIDSAIAREKALKGGSRRKKLQLIDRFNPQWRELYADFA
jgi:putative endonuclease